MPEREAKQRPAGAPEDWGERAPAGAPGEARAERPSETEAQERTAANERPPAEAQAAPEPEAGDEVADDLDALLADVRRERDEYLALAQRAKADFENYRKRTARDAAAAERRGKAGLARELMPALDNLERALRAAGIDPEGEPGAELPQARPAGDPVGPGREAEEPTGSDSEALARGVALVYSELRGTLDRAGVEAYDPAGERFDPATSEVLQTRPADGVEPGTVLETVERGYRLDGQVLRPARVIVAG